MPAPVRNGFIPRRLPLCLVPVQAFSDVLLTSGPFARTIGSDWRCLIDSAATLSIVLDDGTSRYVWRGSIPVDRTLRSANGARNRKQTVQESVLRVDKGYLIMRAAEDEQSHLVWHKIVYRRPPLTVAVGRPSHSHMICVSGTPMPLSRKPGPDILPDAGHMSWSRAMGITACTVACRFVRENTDTRRIVDPFCGRGTLLAVANEFGFDAIGVDLGRKRCRAARNARIVT